MLDFWFALINRKLADNFSDNFMVLSYVPLNHSLRCAVCISPTRWQSAWNRDHTTMLTLHVLFKGTSELVSRWNQRFWCSLYKILMESWLWLILIFMNVAISWRSCFRAMLKNFRNYSASVSEYIIKCFSHSFVFKAVCLSIPVLTIYKQLSTYYNDV